MVKIYTTLSKIVYALEIYCHIIAQNIRFLW